MTRATWEDLLAASDALAIATPGDYYTARVRLENVKASYLGHPPLNAEAIRRIVGAADTPEGSHNGN